MRMYVNLWHEGLPDSVDGIHLALTWAQDKQARFSREPGGLFVGEATTSSVIVTPAVSKPRTRATGRTENQHLLAEQRSIRGRKDTQIVYRNRNLQKARFRLGIRSTIAFAAPSPLDRGMSLRRLQRPLIQRFLSRYGVLRLGYGAYNQPGLDEHPADASQGN